MSALLYFLLTLAVGTVGGLAAYRLKFPAGALIGSIVAVMALNLVFDCAYFYKPFRVLTQVLSGAMIGSRMGKKELLDMKRIALALVISLASMVVFNLLFGALIYKWSPLNAPTALFAVAPGGASDMALIASDLGAEPAFVAFLQIFRLLVIFICLPPIFRKIGVRMQAHPSAGHAGRASAGARTKILSLPFLRLIAFAAIGGAALYFLGVPSGALIGSMLAATISSVCFGKLSYPVRVRLFIQICAGAYIGSQLNRQNISSVGQLLIPMAIMLAGIFLFIAVIGFVMHKATRLDLLTCMFACTPGGLQEVSLLSEEMGTDTPKIAAMQTARIMFVILFFPTMLSFIVRLITQA